MVAHTPHAPPAERNRFGDVRFAILFLALFVVFQFSYSQARGTVVERVAIDHATVFPSAALINLLTPSEQVRAEGHRLVSERARLSVLNGCEGTEALLLLCAAILPFRAPWKQKLFGILLGGALVYAINQARIVSLYYALRYDKGLFDAIHGYIGPTLIVILACLFFLWWVRRIGNHADNPAQPA